MLQDIHSPSDLKKLDMKQLKALCDEIRQCLINTIPKTGGHLASNLGTVELSVALEFVYGEDDKIIYDVGHQAYTHKLVTGRQPQFDTLRQWQGLSGFPKPNEHKSDLFATGHSSTSVSLGIGLSTAMNLKNEKHNVICVIGDGALTGGLSFEAFNNIADNKMLVVLNDNEMSIGKNVGGLNKSLSKLRVGRRYIKFKRGVKSVLTHIPLIGKPLVRLASFIKRWLKFTFLNNLYFENFNMKYLGPTDGHNIEDLIEIFSSLKDNILKPTLLHIVTTKGKGIVEAEKNPECFHGLSGTNNTSYKYSMSQVLGESFVEFADNGSEIAVVSAAMVEGSGLSAFENSKYSNRLFDVGIAEGHAVTFASALAKGGVKPFVCIYSTFLQRAYDNIIHDVCISDIGVTFCIDRSGLVGSDGETHQGTFDISYLTSMPNMTILAPVSTAELKNMLKFSLEFNRPLAIKYSKGVNIDIETNENNLTKWVQVFNPKAKIQLLCVGGIILEQAMKAQANCNKPNRVGIVNARCIKPIDEEFIRQLPIDATIVTIEENNINGGFGSMVNNFVLKNNMDNQVVNLAIKDEFIPHGSVSEQLKFCELDEISITKLVNRLLS